MDIETFRTFHGEMKTVPDDLVQGELDAALAFVEEAKFFATGSSNQDQIQRFRAALQISALPYAKAARLVDDSKVASYQKQFDRLWFLSVAGL
jgi:hypothetical protein